MKSATETTVRDYLRIAFRRKWLFVIPFVLISLSAIPIYEVMPPKYTAKARVTRKDLAIVQYSTKGVVAGGGVAANLSVIQAEILSWPNLDKVVRRLRMHVDLQTPLDWQNMYERLQKNIKIRSIARGRGVDIVDISATAAKQAQRIANAIADAYVEQSKQGETSQSRMAIEFLQEGCDNYLRKLHEVEDKILEFQRLHAADMPNIQTDYMSRIRELSTKRAANQFQLESAKERLETIGEQLERVEQRITVEEVQRVNPRYTQAANALDQLKEALDNALLTMKEEHPTIKRMRNLLAALEQKVKDMPQTILDQEVEQINPLFQQLLIRRSEVEQEIRGLEASTVGMESHIKAHQDQIAKVAKSAQRYTDLVRQKEEYGNLYNQYQVKLTQAQTRLKSETGGYGRLVELLARALVPAKPSNNPIKIALACLVVGLFAGVCLVFLAEFSDHSFRSVDDAASFLELPVMGSVAKIGTPSERAHRKRVMAAVFIFVFLGLGAIIGGSAWYEHAHPGTLRGVVRHLQDALE